MNRTQTMLIGQGASYLLLGLWPLFHMKSFEKVTGPKTDRWLVKTVGLLIAVNGGVMLRSGIREPRSEAAQLLALGNCLALGSISSYYSLRGVISKAYLLDGFSEFSLAAAWARSSTL